jgi:hypothetical protein
MYIGKTPIVGNFQKCDALTASATADYTLQVGSVNVSPESVNHMIVSLNGVIQAPTTAYTVAGAVLSFASALTSADSIDFILLLGNVLDIGTPSDGTVSTAKIADVNVTTGKIADDAITLAKMASGTDGNVISYDASGNPVAIATGNDGQLLTSTGAGSPPAFEDAAGGGIVLLNKTVLSSTPATVDFNQLMTTSYDTYKIVMSGIASGSSGVNISMLFQTTGESSGAYNAGSTYSWETSRTYDMDTHSLTSQAFAKIGRNGFGDSAGDRYASAEITILNASSTVSYKMWSYRGFCTNHDGVNSGETGAGIFKNNARLTGVRFLYSTGTFATAVAGSSIALYGIVNS